MTHATDIVAYTYDAETLCRECTFEATASFDMAYPPEARAWSTEQLLDFIAAHIGVDRQDERSFDSGDFPKVVFASQVEPCGEADCPACGEIDGLCHRERCDGCGEPLV